MGKKKSKDDYLNEIMDYVESLDDPDQLEFMSNLLCFTAAAGERSHVERLGLLECARAYIERYIINADTEEEKKRLINNN